MKIQVELNLEDVFEEAMYNEATLKEEFTSSVRLAVVRELKEKFKNELMREISNPISEKIEDIARESMNDLVENASEKKYRFRLDYMDEELTVDEFIRGRMKKVVDRNIETMVESKAKSFVNELRKRYDMAFAAFIVDNMRKQNMLKDEKIAELLKIIQMRGREDAKGRRRSVLMTPPVLSNSEMPFRRIFLEAKRSLSLIEPHPGQTHVRSRNNRPLLMQPHSQVLEEGYHLSILCTITPYFEAIYVSLLIKEE